MSDDEDGVCRQLISIYYPFQRRRGRGKSHSRQIQPKRKNIYSVFRPNDMLLLLRRYSNINNKPPTFKITRNRPRHRLMRGSSNHYRHIVSTVLRTAQYNAILNYSFQKFQHTNNLLPGTISSLPRPPPPPMQHPTPIQQDTTSPHEGQDSSRPRLIAKHPIL